MAGSTEGYSHPSCIFGCKGIRTSENVTNPLHMSPSHVGFNMRSSVAVLRLQLASSASTRVLHELNNPHARIVRITTAAGYGRAENPQAAPRKAQCASLYLYG